MDGMDGRDACMHGNPVVGSTHHLSFSFLFPSFSPARCSPRKRGWIDRMLRYRTWTSPVQSGHKKHKNTRTTKREEQEGEKKRRRKKKRKENKERQGDQVNQVFLSPRIDEKRRFCFSSIYTMEAKRKKPRPSSPFRLLIDRGGSWPTNAINWRQNPLMSHMPPPGSERVEANGKILRRQSLQFMRVMALSVREEPASFCFFLAPSSRHHLLGFRAS